MRQRPISSSVLVVQSFIYSFSAPLWILFYVSFSSNSFSSVRGDSVPPSRSWWGTSVTPKCNSAAGGPHRPPSLDSLCTRQTHPPSSPPPFPSLVQERWTLEETPTGALTPPLHLPFTQTHSTCPACGFVPTITLQRSSFYLFFFGFVFLLRFVCVSLSIQNVLLSIFFFIIRKQ